MVEASKILYVKPKLKGTMLQGWKRVEEQSEHKVKPNINMGIHGSKIAEQFLRADYATELFNNLLISVGLYKLLLLRPFCARRYKMCAQQ